MKSKKFWHRKYVKQLEEKLHSGENYVLFDTKLIIILFFVAIIVSFFTAKKIVANYKESEKISFESKNVLKIVFFDVRQGDSALVTFPSGKNVLIDAGASKGVTIEESDSGKLVMEFDAGKEVLVPYFKTLINNVPPSNIENQQVTNASSRQNVGIQHQIQSNTNDTILDGIIITHPHSDHFGGVFALLEERTFGRPKWFMDSGFITSHPEYYKLLQLIKKEKIEYRIAKPQEKIVYNSEIYNSSQAFIPINRQDSELTTSNKVICEILAPVNKYESESVDRAVNNSSIVLKITYNNVSVLFTGDIETFAELDLLEYKEKLKSTILKVPHHGSFSSTSLPFLDAVSPEVAIISCGRGNPFGHPHEETIVKLNERKIKIYRTDQNGNITFITDGNKYKITVEKEY